MDTSTNLWVWSTRGVDTVDIVLFSLETLIFETAGVLVQELFSNIIIYNITTKSLSNLDLS